MEERRKYTKEFDGWKIYLKKTTGVGPLIDIDHYQVFDKGRYWVMPIARWLTHAINGNIANGIKKIKLFSELQYDSLKDLWLRGRPVFEKDEERKAREFWKKETKNEHKGPYYKLTEATKEEVFYVPQEILLKLFEEFKKDKEKKRENLWKEFEVKDPGLFVFFGGFEANTDELTLVTAMETIAKDLVEAEIKPWEMKEPWVQEEQKYLHQLRSKLYRMLDEAGCFQAQGFFDERRQYLKAWNYDALLSFVDACYYLEEYVHNKEREKKYDLYEEDLLNRFTKYEKEQSARIAPVSPDWFRYETQAPVGWGMHEFLLLCEEVWRERMGEASNWTGSFEDERVPGYKLYWRLEEDVAKLVCARPMLKK